MISYKRDGFERQSLSKVKMSRGSLICERVRKTIVEYFKNNVPQCQIVEISVLKVFGPSEDTASLIGMILSLTLLNGPRNTSRNHCW